MEVAPELEVLRAGALEVRPGDALATADGRPRSLDVYVHKLSAKLEAALPDWTFIHTHVGFGYRLLDRTAAHSR